jgi:hypothetical protein
VDEEQTMLNYDGLDLEQNTVAMMTSDISGYKKYRQKQFQTHHKVSHCTDKGEVPVVPEVAN